MAAAAAGLGRPAPPRPGTSGLEARHAARCSSGRRDGPAAAGQSLRPRAPAFLRALSPARHLRAAPLPELLPARVARHGGRHLIPLPAARHGAARGPDPLPQASLAPIPSHRNGTERRHLGTGKQPRSSFASPGGPEASANQK